MSFVTKQYRCLLEHETWAYSMLPKEALYALNKAVETLVHWNVEGELLVCTYVRVCCASMKKKKKMEAPVRCFIIYKNKSTNCH